MSEHKINYKRIKITTDGCETYVVREITKFKSTKLKLMC